MRAWVAVVVMLGCESAGDKPPSPPAPVAKPTPDAAASWTLEMTYSYGPCSVDDLRPCHIGWTATADGKIVKVAAPNDPRKPSQTTTIAMSAAERDELAAIVASPEFADGMAKGFPCQGGGTDPDAMLGIAFGAHRQQIGFCVHHGQDNVPARIERLVRR